MITDHNSEKEKPSDRLKAAIVGRYKVGKSWLCATARKPVLVLDYDLRAEALAGKPGVYVKSFQDPVWFKQPESFQQTIDLIAKLEDTRKLRDLGFPDAPEGLELRSLAFDSVQGLAACAMRQGLYGSKDIRRSIQFGPAYTAMVPNSFDGWNAEMKAMEDLIIRAMGLPIDLLVTFHEVAEEAPDSSPEKPKLTGRIAVYPARLKLLLKNFNELWRVDLAPSTNGKTTYYTPKVQCRPDYRFDACTAMSLDQFEEPNIEGMIRKHLERSK